MNITAVVASPENENYDPELTIANFELADYANDDETRPNVIVQALGQPLQSLVEYIGVRHCKAYADGIALWLAHASSGDSLRITCINKESVLVIGYSDRPPTRPILITELIVRSAMQDTILLQDACTSAVLPYSPSGFELTPDDVDEIDGKKKPKKGKKKEPEQPVAKKKSKK